uniref:Phosphodiesterase n=1 Tax=Spermophilus dauricus TaxID=99837 RepID=A0A8C9UV59_SPEDA
SSVLVIPLVDKEAGAVAAGSLGVHCGQLSDSEEWNLQAVEKHVRTWTRPPRRIGALPDPRPVLAGELYDLDATSLQLKVLQYLQQETQASRCCLLLVSEDNLQLSCKVIGDKVLGEEISFPLTMGRLGQVVEDKKSIQLKDLTSVSHGLMLQDMNFINNYKIDCPTLARFCLMVKKGYRDPPYHNWMHAFSVSHFCYLLYKNLELTNYLEDIEIFALFISCMCHDLDHRGTNNSFQVASVRPALPKQEPSLMHHFAQAIAILNTHGCNIFDHFSRKDYQRMLDLMRDIILATDLAHHLRIFKDLQKMAEVGYDRTNKQHHRLLLCLLMTSCDLSDQTKGWKTTRKIAELIYKEFFSQGDLEKAMGNRPMEMMDREKAYIPELQISFMEHIAMPIYKLLQDLFPKAAELYERVASNREHWTKVSHKFTIRGLPSNNSLDFLDEEYEVPEVDGTRAPVNGCCSLDAE